MLLRVLTQDTQVVVEGHVFPLNRGRHCERLCHVPYDPQHGKTNDTQGVPCSVGKSSVDREDTGGRILPWMLLHSQFTFLLHKCSTY